MIQNLNLILAKTCMLSLDMLKFTCILKSMHGKSIKLIGMEGGEGGEGGWGNVHLCNSL